MTEPQPVMEQAEQDKLTRQVGRALLTVAGKAGRRCARSTGRRAGTSRSTCSSRARTARRGRCARRWRSSRGSASCGRACTARAGGPGCRRCTCWTRRAASAPEFEPDVEPRWRRVPPPIGFADELRFFPRADEHIPDWLRQRAGLRPAGDSPTPPGGMPGVGQPGAPGHAAAGQPPMPPAPGQPVPGQPAPGQPMPAHGGQGTPPGGMPQPERPVPAQGQPGGIPGGPQPGGPAARPAGARRPCRSTASTGLGSIQAGRSYATPSSATLLHASVNPALPCQLYELDGLAAAQLACNRLSRRGRAFGPTTPGDQPTATPPRQMIPSRPAP